jgi:hypothetical protein
MRGVVAGLPIPRGTPIYTVIGDDGYGRTLMADELTPVEDGSYRP